MEVRRDKGKRESGELYRTRNANAKAIFKFRPKPNSCERIVSDVYNLGLIDAQTY